MIIAQGNRGGKRAVVLVLTNENVRRLQNDEPIVMTPATHVGLAGFVPDDGEVVIMLAETASAARLFGQAVEEGVVRVVTDNPEDL